MAEANPYSEVIKNALYFPYFSSMLRPSCFPFRWNDQVRGHVQNDTLIACGHTLVLVDHLVYQISYQKTILTGYGMLETPHIYRLIHKTDCIGVINPMPWPYSI
jgi:hypothetical protein